MSLPRFLEAMLDRAIYPHRPDEVRLVQTHISYVLLAGGEVYKVKKPVRYSFLDFSTLELRHRFCHEEVRLNRRLAPGIYRGVVAVCEDPSGFRLGAEHDPAALEYAVHMKRLPEGRMLDRLLERGQVSREMLEQLAATLVRFHREANADDAVGANGDPAAVSRLLEDNFTGARNFRGETIAAPDDDAIKAFVRSFLNEQQELLRRRQAERRIRDGHGDLHTEHVCFADPLVIYDCIEFNPKFRHMDVAAEIAFLVMDMTYHGHEELAAYFAARYASIAGDRELLRLLPFYACYRAYVRGKVDSLKSVEEEVDPADRAAARESARRHFALAYRYTWAYKPALVVFGGLSGTGKSSLARALRDRTGFRLVSSDVVRKELAGLPATARAAGPYDAGIYTPEMNARTYAALLERAASELSGGRGVILDATFSRREGRIHAREIARRQAKPFLLVECRCPEEVIRERIEDRARRGGDSSDADWRIYVEQKKQFEPYDDRDEGDRLVLETNRPAEDLTRRIEDVLRKRSGVVSG